MKTNSKFKKVAIQAVKEAGKILKQHFRKPLRVSFKKCFSLVTPVDFKAERIIIKLIKKNFPSHDILAEERGGKIGRNYTWLIDALDGTTNYVKKVPFFAVSLALLYRRKLILGAVFNPVSQELYFAEKGRGVFLNGKRVKINGKRVKIKQQQNLSRSTILFAKGRSKRSFMKFCQILKKVGKQCRAFRFWGSSSLEFCHVASGEIDGLD